MLAPHAVAEAVIISSLIASHCFIMFHICRTIRRRTQRTRKIIKINTAFQFDKVQYFVFVVMHMLKVRCQLILL